MHREHAERRQGLSLPRFADDPTLTALVNKACGDPATRAPVNPNSYALQADTLDFLAALLDLTTPRSIVEFGSGASTKVFARWAAAHGASVVSIEHDRGWTDDVRRQLEPAQRDAVRLIHAPLRPARAGFRQFMTYRRLADLAETVNAADLFLLDGPHMSGREMVLYFVLTHCRPGAVIVVDDLRHYAVFEMLARLPEQAASCFAGAPIEENAHGLFVLRCLDRPANVRVPMGGVRSVLRSYWRCLRDLRQYGTGD